MAQYKRRSMTNLAASFPKQVRPNFWLRLASYGQSERPETVEQRERIRRSGLMAWILLGLFVGVLFIVPLGVADPATMSALGVMAVLLIIATLLNRVGQTFAAGSLVIAAITAAIFSALLGQPGGKLPLDALPSYDLLAITVVVGATVLPRMSSFVIALINSALIAADFFLQPHAVDIIHDLPPTVSPVEAAVALISRPIALQIIIAVVAYLWVRSTENAIRRADRAEEIASLEHSLAEQKRQLDIGIQQILQTHVRVANGDFNARTPLGQDNVLWQIAVSLNNLLARLQRTNQAEYQLQRTHEEISHIIAAIDDMQAGRRPIWPAPTGTPADALLERLVQAAQIAAPPRAGPSQPQARPNSQSMSHPNDPHAYGGYPINPPSRAPYSGPDPYSYRAPNSMPSSMPTSRAPNSGYPFPAPETPDQGMHTQGGSNPWAFPLEEDEQHP